MASRGNRSFGRTSLACKTCRQRKVKCSGDWPSCQACTRRLEECQYAGVPSEPHPALTPHHENMPDLPPSTILKEAIHVFFDIYGDFPFWFFRKHTFMEELQDDAVPRCLLLCVLSLVARVVEPCYRMYGGTIEASEHFASCARKEMSTMYDDITLTNVHCNLIMSLYELGHGNEQRAWLLLGIAARLCQSLGLLYETFDDDDDNATIETKRRTFWSWFCLERLLANGRDRPLLVSEPRVTTFLPSSQADFIVGRANCMPSLGSFSTPLDSLPSTLVRIIDILSRITAWGGAGVGGRHEDLRSPWLEDMPFSRLQTELQNWHSSLPPYMAFTEVNIKSHDAGGEGKIFGLMHLAYLTAGTRLHRKYLPFIPPAFYDPAEGPCDGPGLISDPEQSDFWAKSTRQGIVFANQLTNAFVKLEEHHVDPCAIPFSALLLFSASSFHVVCAHTKWESCKEFVGEPAKDLLAYNLQYLVKMQETWPVAAFWIKSLRLFYERVSLAQNIIPDPPARNRPPYFSVKEAMLHYNRSDREKEGLPAHIPLPGHDLFELLDRELQTL
ncbi:fungal-specific transcription factor domain-containing protein [Ilyonectria destructans]|nr:fungal-specific transcription factor domain-containing protein [Ilyonectria destructans]